MDEKWKQVVDTDMKVCNEMRVRLEEHDKTQQKEIDESKSQISELYDYKNDIFRKLTTIDANKVSYKEYNALVKCVTQLKTEKKFLPYLVMGISLLASIASVIYVISKLAGG
jgi:hypothetical protein